MRKMKEKTERHGRSSVHMSRIHTVRTQTYSTYARQLNKPPDLTVLFPSLLVVGFKHCLARGRKSFVVPFSASCFSSFLSFLF